MEYLIFFKSDHPNFDDQILDGGMSATSFTKDNCLKIKYDDQINKLASFVEN